MMEQLSQSCPECKGVGGGEVLKTVDGRVEEEFVQCGVCHGQARIPTAAGQELIDFLNHFGNREN